MCRDVRDDARYNDGRFLEVGAASLGTEEQRAKLQKAGFDPETFAQLQQSYRQAEAHGVARCYTLLHYPTLFSEALGDGYVMVGDGPELIDEFLDYCVRNSSSMLVFFLWPQVSVHGESCTATGFMASSPRQGRLSTGFPRGT